MTSSIGAWDPALLTGAPPPSAVDDLAYLVAERLQVPVWKLKSAGPGSAHIAFARQIVMYLAREVLKLSWHEIGDALQRNHSTVIHGCNLIKARMEARPEFRARIETLTLRAEV